MCITENGTHVVALSIDHSADQHPIGLHLVEYHIGLERHEFRCGFFTGRSFKNLRPDAFEVTNGNRGVFNPYLRLLWKCARTSSSDTQPSSSPERMPVLSSHIRRSIAFAFSNSSSSAISRIVKRPRPLTVRYTGEPAETCSRTVL